MSSTWKNTLDKVSFPIAEAWAEYDVLPMPQVSDTWLSLTRLAATPSSGVRSSKSSRFNYGICLITVAHDWTESGHLITVRLYGLDSSATIWPVGALAIAR